MTFPFKRECLGKFWKHCFHFLENRMIATDPTCPKCFEEMRVFKCGRCGAEVFQSRHEYSK